MKLTAILTLAVLSALPFAAGTAHADEPATCADDQVASGPYCVNPIYVNNPLFVDPATCEFGYFQGNCVPDTLGDPVDHPAVEYTYQTPTPAVAAVTVETAPVIVWLTVVELQLADSGNAR